MRNRYILLLPTVVALAFGGMTLQAQQAQMFTNYHFNSLFFNPAYAGSNEHLSLNFSHRQQWLGFEDAPLTQTITAHTPLENDRIGVGLALSNDRIGPAGSTGLDASYAYRLPLKSGSDMKLAIGLQAGIANWRGKFTDITIEHSDDPAFQENLSRWLPNMGLGAYLSGKQFYAGISCPQLLEYDLRQARGDSPGLYAKNYRHLYFSTGGAFPLNGDQLIFKPSLLIQTAGFLSKIDDRNVGAPASMNLGAAVLLRQLFWVGVSYRSALSGKSSTDAFNLWLAWSLRNGLRFGAAYDITLSALRNAGSNSFELMLGYEFDIKVKQVSSPRYF